MCTCLLCAVCCFDMCGCCEMISTLGLVSIPVTHISCVCAECVEAHGALLLSAVTLVFVRSRALVSMNDVRSMLSESPTASVSICIQTYLSFMCRAVPVFGRTECAVHQLPNLVLQKEIESTVRHTCFRCT